MRATIQQINKTSKKAIIFAAIPFKDLNGRLRFSYRSQDTPREYQREWDNHRVNSIASFIITSVNSEIEGKTSPIFTTSVILASDNDWIDFSKEQTGCDIDIKFDESTSFRVVDGQHRLKAMEQTSDHYKSSVVSSLQSSYVDNYLFNCTILINFDLWEQAKVFADVNFNQKKVNKSLFYDIYGIILPDGEQFSIPKHNEIYIAHNLVEKLNNDPSSAFRGFVKMLGKGKGFVSQAFLVEAIMEHLRPLGIWSDVLNPNEKTDELVAFMTNEFLSYFAALRFTFFDLWPSEDATRHNSLLCKTTGIGACMMLLSDIHRAIKSSVIIGLRTQPSSPIAIAAMVVAFCDELEHIKSCADLFSLDKVDGQDNIFARGAGRGMQKALYEELLSTWIKKRINTPK